MSNTDLIIQCLIMFGLVGVIICMGVWVCEQLDLRDPDHDADWWGEQ